ncbi:hypothetical protein N1851_021328 [Merluccius polli]|uniref:Uncharacterized protein n=1 Tax=Merluccius polli TaxID=89951 RepID=A0AA47MJL3_MERPO|nr:hypothetical protein N1851_021328 [Merluccius polli]
MCLYTDLQICGLIKIIITVLTAAAAAAAAVGVCVYKKRNGSHSSSGISEEQSPAPEAEPLNTVSPGVSVLPRAAGNGILPAGMNRILFTGPDGVGDYRSRRPDSCPCYVGSGTPSQEASGGLAYLTRAPPSPPWVPGVSGVPGVLGVPGVPGVSGVPGVPGPRRSRPPPRVGAVGWGWRYNQLLNSTTLLSNMQIKVSAVRGQRSGLGSKERGSN